jgi:hypothetical protein
MGTAIPDIVKPVPVSVAALTVTAPVPVDVRVTDCADWLFTVTLPKARLVVLMVSAGTVVDDATFSCRVKFSEALPAVAVNVDV